MYDYSKLRGRIVEKYGTMSQFSEAFGISLEAMSRKMNGKSEWGQAQIVKASDLLDIDPQEIHRYFFTQNVQKV